ncbi:MAG: DinB family protein [Chloroflexota bacterium]|nr:DinB family protein [Chloroflexota bacterium]
MDDDRRGKLIEQYRDGYRVITEALEGITNTEMDAREGSQEWSPREIIHHLADSEMTSAIRLRRLLAEETPEIIGYDQEAYARILYYDRPIEPSLEAFRYARESTAQLLERMTDVEWERAGTHSESGVYSVEGWLEIYAVHAHEHADQIRRARAMVE